MHVIRNHDVTSENGKKEKISANDFYVDIEDLKELDDKEIVARADAQAWNQKRMSTSPLVRLNMN